MVRVCFIDREIHVQFLTPTKTLVSAVSAYDPSLRKVEAGGSLGLPWPDTLAEIISSGSSETLGNVI